MFLLLHVKDVKDLPINEETGRAERVDIEIPHLVNDHFITSITSRFGCLPHEPGVVLSFSSNREVSYTESFNDVIEQMNARRDIDLFEAPPQITFVPEDETVLSNFEVVLDSDGKPVEVSVVPTKKGNKKED